MNKAKKSFVRLGAAQINPTVGDLEGNTCKITQWIEKARNRGVQYLVFPELSICGYPPKDLLLKTQFIADQQKYLDEIIPLTKGMLVVVGLVIREGDSFNAAAVIHDGALLGFARKVGLPNYRVFDEKRYFQSGSHLSIFHTDLGGVGILICEDMWQPQTVANITATGVDLILCLSASPFNVGRPIERDILIKSRCQDFSVGVVFCNQVGGQDELIFDGRSMIVSPQARSIVQAKAFEEDLIVGDIRFEDIHRGRLAVPIQRDFSLEDMPGSEGVKLYRSMGKTAPALMNNSAIDLRQNPFLPQPVIMSYDPIEDAYHALVLGVKDYVKKNGFKSVVLGLSGGIDSALTVALAVDALGAENVVGVSMPSCYSTEHSQSDSAKLAKNLGIEYKIFAIEEVFSQYLHLFDEEFQGLKPDITEENLQSRIRGNILMGLSNKFGHLVLATGNKSEMSVGYATLYGDMCGGLAVIADVPKTMVFEMVRYRNRLAGYDIIPENILNKPPSAELRADQKDTDTLPEYDILDGILHAYIEQDCSMEEIVDLGYDFDLVQKTVNMVDRAEYKRRQAAIVLRVTSKAFGSDRRLPVTNKYRS